MPNSPRRVGFYTLPMNFLSARYKTAPYIKPNFPCRTGFYTLPTNFLSARCKTAPYIDPIFPCRAGFYTLPTKFFPARCKTAPYIKPKMNLTLIFSPLEVTQLDVGAAAKPPVGTVLKPYKGCFRADYRLPLQK